EAARPRPDGAAGAHLHQVDRLGRGAGPPGLRPGAVASSRSVGLVVAGKGRVVDRSNSDQVAVQEPIFASVDEVIDRLAETGYLADKATATSVFLADRLGKPLLIEGPAGVGKTELSRAVAQTAGAELVRLQCYEGVDEARALYEWNHAKQILRIQASSENDWEETKADVFTEEFLLARPLLTAIRRTEPTVLLIDETDKADVEIEGLLLEVLSDFAV